MSQVRRDNAAHQSLDRERRQSAVSTTALRLTVPSFRKAWQDERVTALPLQPAPEIRILHGAAPLHATVLELALREGWAVKSYEAASELLSQSRDRVASCLILDIQPPDIHGLDIQNRLRGQPHLKLIFVTQSTDVRTSVRAMKAGAVEYLTMPVVEAELRTAMRCAIAQSSAMLAYIEDMRHLRARFASLTYREREVMSLVVAGRLNKLIAAQLRISEVTVKVHRRRVMQKMHARSLPALVNMVNRLTEHAYEEDSPWLATNLPSSAARMNAGRTEQQTLPTAF